MRVYILTDLEGVAGVASFRNDTYADARFYREARRLLTEEVNAAVRGCLEAGAAEIVVWDGHGPGGVNPEGLHEEAQLLFGSDEPPQLGLDRGFDAAMFIGQHAMSGTPKGNLAHSYSSRTVREMTLNGTPIGEVGVRTYLAGHFGVPVVLLSGDRAACEEAKGLLPEIETVAVKEGISLNCALSLSPKKAREMIQQGVREALGNRAKVAPLKLEPPYEFTVEYLSAEAADRAAGGGWERLSATKVRKVSDDYLEIAR